MIAASGQQHNACMPDKELHHGCRPPDIRHGCLAEEDGVEAAENWTGRGIAQGLTIAE